ncbi:FAD-dependent monooxygenase [Aurantimonas marina]|uniref:FAD-dependent monooxygenase n=1 Tax=Aurantimonas marina TaxID=2780508 RepID=UPI0019D0CB46|nr:FAD-dependent monooxygenase [Aurantimonas marina]
MVDLTRPITIIGAGMGGLTAALALADRGFSVEIFERAEQMREVGAGLQLSPNALRVLGGLGLMDALLVHGTRAQDVILRRAFTGRRIASIPVVANDGMPYVSIHRADLQTVLLRAVDRSPAITLRLGASLQALTPARSGLDLWFTGSEARHRHHASLVVGADGVHSSIARRLGLAAATSAGTIAWRGCVSRATGDDVTPGIEAWLGPRRHAIAYPISGGRETNLVLIEPMNRTTEADPTGLAHRFRSWDRRLTSMIAAAGDMTGWPLNVVPPTRSWRHLDDRLILIGDAAHAMLPYAAQGAGMAIEDAAVLADTLARAPTQSAALAHYESERRPRIARVRRRVLFHRLIYHLPAPLSFGRNTALAIRSPESLGKDLDWLYDWRHPVPSRDVGDD